MVALRVTDLWSFLVSKLMCSQLAEVGFKSERIIQFLSKSCNRSGRDGWFIVSN